MFGLKNKKKVLDYALLSGGMIIEKIPSVCHSVDCGDPEAPGNGTVDTPTGTTVGNPAIYECNGGFYISSCDARVCLSTGEWSGTMPTCTPARK